MNTSAYIKSQIKGSPAIISNNVPVYHMFVKNAPQGVYVVFYLDTINVQNIGCGKIVKQELTIQIFSDPDSISEDMLAQQIGCEISSIIANLQPSDCGIATGCGNGVWDEDFIEVCGTYTKVWDANFVIDFI